VSNVQIFGLKNSQTSRAAERFFKERRVPIQLVDLKQKPMSAGEIKRFIDRFGLAQLVDSEGAAFIDAGLKYLKLTDSELLAKIERERNSSVCRWCAPPTASASVTTRSRGRPCSAVPMNERLIARIEREADASKLSKS